MEITLNKQQLSELIAEVVGGAPDDIKLLDAMYKRCRGGVEALVEEKIKVLVGRGLDHWLAGVSFEGRQELIKKMAPGDLVEFQCQPNNPHDPNAVAAFHDGNQIGFLPKESAALLKDIAPGVVGRVTKITSNNDNSNLGVRFVYQRKVNVKPMVSINYDAIAVALEAASEERIGRERIAMHEVISKTTDVQKKKKQKNKKTEEIPMDANILPEALPVEKEHMDETPAAEPQQIADPEQKPDQAPDMAEKKNDAQPEFSPKDEDPDEEIIF